MGSYLRGILRSSVGAALVAAALASGAPAMAFASVPDGAMAWTQGAGLVKQIRSSSFGHRSICSNCGTALQIRVDFQPETVDFSAATLDEPGAVQPGFHIFWSSKVPWFNPGDNLPRYNRFRPQTRGLKGTEPPV